MSLYVVELNYCIVELHLNLVSKTKEIEVPLTLTLTLGRLLNFPKTSIFSSTHEDKYRIFTVGSY